MRVHALIDIDISEKEVKRIFLEYLKDLTKRPGHLTDELIIRKGQLCHYHEHYHNGAEMLDYIGEVDDPQFTVQVAAIRLQVAIDVQERLSYQK